MAGVDYIKVQRIFTVSIDPVVLHRNRGSHASPQALGARET